MEDDIFADTSYGQAALAKIKPTDPNFRLYCCGFVGNSNDTMECTGAVFRAAKSGPNKGLLRVMVPGTRRTAYVTLDSIELAAKYETLKAVASLALASHGVSLLTNPPKDAWDYHGVSDKLRRALAQ